MLTILTFFTLFTVLTTLLPLSRHPHWIVRGMDFPCLQFTILATILLLAYFIFLDPQRVSTQALIISTTLCLIWQLS
jgi:hypothetical protein